MLVRVACTGVCAADLHLARRQLAYLQPTVDVFGHEGAGTVAAVGPSVGGRWRVGERVGIRWLHHVCGTCEACRAGHENVCPRRW